MAEKPTRPRVVIFRNSSLKSLSQEQKVNKSRIGLRNREQNPVSQYGTLPASNRLCRVIEPTRSRQNVGSQTDPCPLESALGPSVDVGQDQDASSLSADISNIVYSFRSVTTIHGVQHAAAARTRSFRRRLWAILVSVMAIFLTWFLFQQVTALLSHEISTTTTFDLRETMDFPAVTLCNLNQYNKNRVPLNYTVESVFFYMSEYSRVAREFDPNYTEPDLAKVKDVPGEELLEIATHAAPTLDEFLVQCRWKGVHYKCRDLFHPTHTPQGRCYTFDMFLNLQVQTARVGEWEGLEVMLNIQQENSYYSEELHAGIKIMVHRSGEKPFSKKNGWHIRPGVFASVALTQHNRQGLPKPYKAYKNRYCEDTNSPDFKNPLKRYNRYTAANCIEECFVDRLVKLCGCRSFNDAGNDTICSSLQMLTCYVPAKYNSSSGFPADNDCNCPEECDVTTYTAALSYADFSSRFEQLQMARSNVYPNIENLRRSFMSIRIYFESMSVDTLRQQPAVSILDIFGTIGGQMGIFLGCSILSIIELIEMGLLICIRCSWEIYHNWFRSPNSRVASLVRKAVEDTSLGTTLSKQQERATEKSQGSLARPLMEIPE